MIIAKIKSLNVYYKTAIISSLVGILLVAITCFLFFIDWKEIPLGFLVGLFVGVIFECLIGIVSDKTKISNKKGSFLTIFLTTIRVVVIGGTLFLIGYLYYGIGVRIFNIFSASFGYLLVTIILVILTLISKGNVDE